MSEVTTDKYFGGCPECGGNDGYLNANRKDHWYVCHKHLTNWFVDTNLFSTWQNMTDEELAEQNEQLKGYREVKPVMAKPPSIQEAEPFRAGKPATFIERFLGLDD